MNKGTSEERMCKERVLWPNQLGQWSPENCHCFLKSKRPWTGLTWAPPHLQEHFFRGSSTVSPMFSLLSIRTLFCLSFSWKLSESWCFRQPHLGSITMSPGTFSPQAQLSEVLKRFCSISLPGTPVLIQTNSPLLQGCLLGSPERSPLSFNPLVAAADLPIPSVRRAQKRVSWLNSPWPRNHHIFTVMWKPILQAFPSLSFNTPWSLLCVIHPFYWPPSGCICGFRAWFIQKILLCKLWLF